jgi:hypothetical protein
VTDDNLDTFYEQVGTESHRLHANTAVGGVSYAMNPGQPPQPAQTPPIGPVSAWAVNGDRYWGISHSIPTVPPGCYRPAHSDGIGVHLQEQLIRTDALIELPDSKSEAIIAELEQFAALRPSFVARGFLYKRGFLLWGPPGSGKTSTMNFLMRRVVDRLQGIAVLVDHPELAAKALELVRKIEPERQIIAILEDFDGLLARYSESDYLALLDGEAQVDNIVFVATTNYPERIDKRFVDRPSRFDTVEYVGMPSPEARRAYFQHKEPTLDVLVIEEMVDATDGLSIAHLREMIILTQCFGRSIADAAKRLNASRHKPPHSERTPEHVGAGFGGAWR